MEIKFWGNTEYHRVWRKGIIKFKWTLSVEYKVTNYKQGQSWHW